DRDPAGQRGDPAAARPPRGPVGALARRGQRRRRVHPRPGGLLRAARPARHRAADRTLFTFLEVGKLKITFGLLFDPLSAIFVLLITGVGFLIHLYAVGYMADDPGRRRFFAYFNLFVAAMLLLVLGNNYVMLYVGWEGVGLASYLLISFWYLRPSAATAGKKAFIMNRVGDAGLAVAIFLMFATIGSVQYADVFTGVGKVSSGIQL